MGVKAEALTGGFSDAVFDSQRVFKKLMDGMARPGTTQAVETAVFPPLPLAAATGAVLLALCDHDTPVWLSSALRKTAVPGWIGFHTGASCDRRKGHGTFRGLRGRQRHFVLRSLRPGKPGISRPFHHAHHRVA